MAHLAVVVLAQPHTGQFLQLFKAIHGTKADIARVLRRGVSADVRDARGQNVLWALAAQPSRRRFYDNIKYLILEGASLAPRREGGTLLMDAARNRSLWVARAFLEAGVDPNAYAGGTALSLALLGRNSAEAYRKLEPDPYPVVELLLKYKANANRESGYVGTLPLCIAAHDGRLDLCRVLVAAGASVNKKQTNLGYTPLHTACLKNRKENAAVVGYLLKKGARKDAKDELGRTPLEMAEQKGYTLIVQALKGS